MNELSPQYNVTSQHFYNPQTKEGNLFTAVFMFTAEGSAIWESRPPQKADIPRSEGRPPLLAITDK